MKVEHQDRLGSLETQETEVLLVQLDHVDLMDPPDQLAQQVLVVIEVIRASKGILAPVDLLDPLGLLDQEVQLVQVDHQDLLDQKAAQDQLVQQEVQVIEVSKVKQGLQGLLGQQVTEDLRDPLEAKEIRVIEVPQEKQVFYSCNNLLLTSKLLLGSLQHAEAHLIALYERESWSNGPNRTGWSTWFNWCNRTLRAKWTFWSLWTNWTKWTSRK